MTSAKPRVGEPVSPFDLQNVDGGAVQIGEPKERWTMLFVYRGRHCPRCKTFLNRLNAALVDWDALLDVVVVSADTRDKALADREEFGWSFTLCHGLAETQMRALGLYVSDPLSEAETDARFAEPGTFAIRPDGVLMLADISNGPSARPDLGDLLDGMRFNIKNSRPPRGMA